MPVHQAEPSDPALSTVQSFVANRKAADRKAIVQEQLEGLEERMNEKSGSKSGSPTMNELLVAVATRQDRDAFAALFAHFAPRLNAFILGQGTDAQMAQEVVQEAMVKVWRKAEQFDPSKASASTWIFTIARNLRIDMLRKAARPEPDPDDPTLVPEPEQGAFESISKEQEAHRLRQAIAVLPAEQQEVLKLAFFQEKAHPQIAEQLGIPLGTVKSRIRLAFNRVRQELGDAQ